VHLAYISIVSHLSAKNYRNWWKFDEVLTKTNLLSFFGQSVLFHHYSRSSILLSNYICCFLFPHMQKLNVYNIP